MKLLKILLIVVFGSVIIPSGLIANQKDNATPLTEENWSSHPKTLEIRKIYKEIRAGLDNKGLKYIEKDFSKLPRECRGVYPVEKLAVAYDKKDRVRLYIHAQRISHDDLLTKEHYYDKDGRLRFMFMSNTSEIYATIENRVYVNKAGKVFWDVKTEAKKMKYGEITADPSIISSYTNEYAKNFVERTEVKCDE